MKLELQTDLGSLTLALDLDRAPLSAEHCLRFFTLAPPVSSAFYRIVSRATDVAPVPIEIAQFGVWPWPDTMPLTPVPHEPTGQTGLRHEHGTLSLARREPGSASCAFFICQGDHPELNEGGRRQTDGYGFAAFGRVSSGWATLARIFQAPVREEMIVNPIVISTTRVNEQ